MGQVAVTDLNKRFGSVAAVADVNFTVEDGEFLFLLGPSGCGKTTTLRMVAGLEMPSGGRIAIDSRDVTYLRPRDRNVGMVFERYGLYNHLSVFENIAYPLRVRRMSRQEIRSRVSAVAERLQIADVLDRRPGQLSGGQAQRVAIGRMLVRQADVFLMDEPISHLDAKLRAAMRIELKHLQRELKATTIYVSHDQLEAMTMADRILIMRDGTIQQFDTPKAVFDRPANEFVATFIGEPHMNVLDCRLTTEGARAFLQGDGFRIEVDPDWLARSGDLQRSDGAVRLGIRPEHIGVALPGEAGAEGAVEATLLTIETMGHQNAFAGDVGGTIVLARAAAYETRHIDGGEGRPILFRFDPRRIYLFDPRDGRTLAQAAAVSGEGRAA
ncbi:ABC transporter ATP-binding protein [Chelativorans sp.]|uniref:ABC transporter ATP-binding protein n=1 Tax=Chelativorans sp. TaxID=2203393 RepID=UPI002811AAED|nr:ABC transporter ATP-binding protein [Chelativorans sp.]